MIQFIKDALRELKHVVWPTRAETRNFFFMVCAMLVAFGLYLFVFSNIFSTIIFGLKDTINPGSNQGGTIGSSLSDEEIDAIFSGEGNELNIISDEANLDEDTQESVAEEASATGASISLEDTAASTEE